MNLPGEFPCPTCGEPRGAVEEGCGKCGWRPKPARAPGQPAPVVSTRSLVTAAREVSLSAIFGITGVVALVAAVWTWNRFAGFAFSFLAAIALVRTVLFGLHARIHRDDLLPLELTIAFINSLLFVFVLALSALIAFVMVCFPLGIAGFWYCGHAGVLCAFAVFAFALYKVPVYSKDR